MRDTTPLASKVTCWTPWKQWFVRDLLPFLIFVIALVAFLMHYAENRDKYDFDVVGLFIIVGVILFFPKVIMGVVNVAIKMSHLRTVMKKADQSWLMKAEELFKKDLQWFDGEGANLHPAYCKFAVYLQCKLWKKYFMVEPKLVDKWLKEYVESTDGKMVRRVDMKSIKVFENIMEKLEFQKIADYFSFKRFIISDLVTLLWLGASIVDIYVFITYLQGLDKQVFSILLVLSLVAIRIIAEYTVVLFSIADLTREVRDELRRNNALRKDEKIDDES